MPQEMYVIITTDKTAKRGYTKPSFWFNCRMCQWAVAENLDWDYVKDLVVHHLREEHRVRSRLYLTANSPDGVEWDEPCATVQGLDEITGGRIWAGSIIAPNAVRGHLNMPILTDKLEIFYFKSRGKIKHLGPSNSENETIAQWLARTHPDWVLFYGNISMPED